MPNHIDDFDIQPQSDEFATELERERIEQEHAYRGWAGDGSGEDDFADYNQMEANDYMNEE